MNRPEPHLPTDRCREVLDVLSRPPGRLDPDFQSGHLAECPDCAEAAAVALQLARAWDDGRPPVPTVGFDNLWPQVLARAEALEPAARPGRWTIRIAALVLAQAAAALVAWTFFHDPKPATTLPDHAAPIGMLAMLGDVPAVIDVEPSEVTILRVDHQGSLDRRDIDSLEISDTETVGFDTTVLGYFEALGGS